MFSIKTKLLIARATASVALGDHSPRKLTKAGTREQADRVFTMTYMQGDVVEVYTE
jgi:hypothetical protein